MFLVKKGMESESLFFERWKVDKVIDSMSI